MSIKFASPDNPIRVIRELIIKMYEEKIDSIEIPDSNGQILIKSDSVIIQEKFKDESVSMFPFYVLLEDQTSIGFYICCPH